MSGNRIRTRDASAATVLRVAGPDVGFLLAEEKLGFRSPIQFCWVLDEDPGASAVEKFSAAVSTTLLHRAIVRTRVPGARRRWVASQVIPQVITGARIDDDAIGVWADETLRRADLHPRAGLGWRVLTTTTTANRRVVVLLVSHLVADGEAIMRALAAIGSGETGSRSGATALPDPSSARGRRAVREDLRDARAEFTAARRSIRDMARGLRRSGDPKASRDPQSPREPKTLSRTSTAPGSMPVELSYDANRTALAVLDVDRDLWHERADHFGGTSNTLFTGVLCGVVRRSGYPTGDQVRVSVAVSKRGGPEDVRANASGGIWLRVGADQPTPGPLGVLRGLSRTAFAEYAASGTEVPDDTVSIARLLPRRALAAALRTLPSPDVSVSNLGVLPESIRSMGGVAASSFVLRLMVHGPEAGERVRLPGPGLSAWIVEYGDRVTLSFAGFATDYYGDAARLRDLLTAELAAWGIEHKHW